MRYVLLDESNIVIQVQPNFEEGFLAAPDEVTAGYIYDPVLNTFSAPPPPPLARWKFEEKLRARLAAIEEAKFQALMNLALAESPNYPGLPTTLADFDLILDGMTLPS